MEPIILSSKEAHELCRKYGAGVEEGEVVKIHPLEALYFIERGKLTLAGETFDSLFSKVKTQDQFAAEKYTVIKYLRGLGYITRPSFVDEPWMRLYRKGFRPGEDRTHYLLKVVRQDWKPSLRELQDDMLKAAEARKELVYAVVQENKQPMFFKVARTSFD